MASDAAYILETASFHSLAERRTAEARLREAEEMIREAERERCLRIILALTRPVTPELATRIKQAIRSGDGVSNFSIANSS